MRLAARLEAQNGIGPNMDGAIDQLVVVLRQKRWFVAIKLVKTGCDCPTLRRDHLEQMGRLGSSIHIGQQVGRIEEGVGGVQVARADRKVVGVYVEAPPYLWSAIGFAPAGVLAGFARWQGSIRVRFEALDVPRNLTDHV